GTPFSKARSQLPVFCEPLAQSVETLSDLFARKIRHRLGALVYFDPSDGPLLFQRFDERAPVTSLLPNRFVEENYSANKFAGAFCGKQDLAICASVFFCRRNVDGLQSLLYRLFAFIRYHH